MLRRFVIISFCAIILVLLFLIGFKILRKEKQELQVSVLPDVCTESLKSGQYCFSAQNYDKPIILMFVRIDCATCLNTVLLIKNNQNILDNNNVILIVPERTNQLMSIIATYNLLNYFDILIDDEKRSCFKEFQIVETPATYIYDKNQNLIRKITGEFSLSTLNKYLKN